MKRVYKIEVEGIVLPEMLNGKFFSAMRSTSSLMHVEASCAYLTSILTDHQIIVYNGLCPALRIDVFEGREKRRIDCSDQRKVKELEYDLRKERGKIEFRCGRNPADMSQWIDKGHSDTPSAVRGMTRKTSVKHRVHFSSTEAIARLIK